jgi:hypothetical protein
MKIVKNMRFEVLDSIKLGDHLEDRFGNAGKVIGIDKVYFKKEVHFYFKIKQTKKTILCITLRF